MPYYIICLTHTQRPHNFITLWRPDNGGYCYAKEFAGLYDVPEPGYHDSDYNIPLSEEDANRLFIRVKYDGVLRDMIPNCKAVWDELGVKMTANGLKKIAIPAQKKAA